jgi:hypothetical protein
MIKNLSNLCTPLIHTECLEGYTPLYYVLLEGELRIDFMKILCNEDESVVTTVSEASIPPHSVSAANSGSIR